MMKKFLGLLAALLLLFHGASAEPQVSQTISVPGTAFRFDLPACWNVGETGDDPARTLLIARDQGNSMQLYLWLNQREGWHLSDWESALRKASRHNSVQPESFQDETIGDRPFVSYRWEQKDACSQMYATELSDGVFLTFEFRTSEALLFQDERLQEIEAIPGSLVRETDP